MLFVVCWCLVVVVACCPFGVWLCVGRCVLFVGRRCLLLVVCWLGVGRRSVSWVVGRRRSMCVVCGMCSVFGVRCVLIVVRFIYIYYYYYVVCACCVALGA